MEKDTEFGDLIRKKADYFAAPQDLRDRVGSMLAQTPAEQVPRKAGRWLAWQGWWGMGGAFAMGILLSVALSYLTSLRALPGAQERLVEQVVDSHVRSLMVAHLSDVASSDQHTVKPWLSRQLDFSPPVADLSAEGFPLIGGRLDYIDGRTVAALVYQRRLHTINLFVWPHRGSSASVSAPVATARQGFNVRSWNKDGMQYWVVSDLQSAELDKFGLLLGGQSGSPRLP